MRRAAAAMTSPKSLRVQTWPNTQALYDLRKAEIESANAMARAREQDGQ
jgi:hypothetical protein